MDVLFTIFQRTWAPEGPSPGVYTVEGPSYTVLILPALTDNYQYVVVNQAAGAAVAVDVSEAAAVRRACAKAGVALAAVLTTHFHADHSCGNLELIASDPKLAIFAGDEDATRTPGATSVVRDGDRVEVAGLIFRVLSTPGHTRGHVSFYIDDGSQDPAVFTGDTLFVCGCGRLLEGTPKTMVGSLSKLAQLPPATRVFCGHEYTVGNLTFAIDCEPTAALAEALERARATRKQGKPTVPSTIGDELRLNPFLRVIADCATTDSDPATVEKNNE